MVAFAEFLLHCPCSPPRAIPDILRRVAPREFAVLSEAGIPFCATDNLLLALLHVPDPAHVSVVPNLRLQSVGPLQNLRQTSWLQIPFLLPHQMGDAHWI